MVLNLNSITKFFFDCINTNLRYVCPDHKTSEKYVISFTLIFHHPNHIKLRSFRNRSGVININSTSSARPSTSLGLQFHRAQIVFLFDHFRHPV